MFLSLLLLIEKNDKRLGRGITFSSTILFVYEALPLLVLYQNVDIVPELLGLLVITILMMVIRSWIHLSLPHPSVLWLSPVAGDVGCF